MSTAGNPFFSVIIATYNRKDILFKTIRSVLDQSFRDFELVVVDDGSTDGTSAFLTEKLSGEARFRLLVQENKERGAARNFGIRNAKGSYLVFMDSDDRIDADHLEVLHKHIEAEHQPDLITTKFDIIDQIGIAHATTIAVLKQGYYDYRMLLNGNTLGMYIAVRREIPDFVYFEEARSLSVVEDWLFNFANLRHRSIFLIDRTSYHVMDHEGRSMNGKSEVLIPKIRSAKEWITSNMELSGSEKKQLAAFTDYLAAVHLYLDGMYRSSFQSNLRSILQGGLHRKNLLLGIKCVFGRKTIRMIKNLVGRP